MDEGGVLRIPMKVTVPDQKLPVTFTLRARVTTTDLEFVPAKLDFGPCVMGEATGTYGRMGDSRGVGCLVFVHMSMS